MTPESKPAPPDGAVLPASFFERDTRVVARDLLDKVLVREAFTTEFADAKRTLRIRITSALGAPVLDRAEQSGPRSGAGVDPHLSYSVKVPGARLCAAIQPLHSGVGLICTHSPFLSATFSATSTLVPFGNLPISR